MIIASIQTIVKNKHKTVCPYHCVSVAHVDAYKENVKTYARTHSHPYIQNIWSCNWRTHMLRPTTAWCQKFSIIFFSLQKMHRNQKLIVALWVIFVIIHKESNFYIARNVRPNHVMIAWHWMNSNRIYIIERLYNINQHIQVKSSFYEWIR